MSQKPDREKKEDAAKKMAQSERRPSKARNVSRAKERDTYDQQEESGKIR
jgi:hypothetical protein